MNHALFPTLVLAAAPLMAQASWSLLYPPVTPAPRMVGAFGMHESLGKGVLLFGYDAVSGAPRADAWSLQGDTWAPATGGQPPWRVNAMVVFDAARDEVVLFGGSVPSGPSAFDDTWRWNGTQWLVAAPAIRPPARFSAAMAFDREREVVVLFGGLGSGSPAPVLADTWEWDGVAWTQRSPVTSPPARHVASLAFDPVARCLVLHGGFGDGGSGGTVFADTWHFDGSTWSQRQPTVSPPHRIDARMVTDLHRQRVLLLGGAGGDPFGWEWNGSQWHVSWQPTPAPRASFGIGYDAVARRVVVHGGVVNIGSQGYWLSDTWSYRTPLPADVVAFGAGCTGTAGAPALAAAPYSLPWLGDTLRIAVDAIPVAEPGAAFVSSFGTTLPLSLAFAGAPGCDLLVPADVVEFRAAAAGGAAWDVAIPVAPALAGASFRQQAFVLDAAANALGLVASNGIVATLGIR